MANWDMALLFTLVGLSMSEELQSDSAGSPDEYCLSEIFQPRCLKNEVILMKSATYGRMRVGRCITAEEVDSLGSRYIGCSADVLSQLDPKCSGKSECDIRVVEILVENIKPCPPGLRFHLEAAYDCITVADERPSCAVDISSTPIHIVDSTTCGTKSQPWIVEAPIGQKISISLIALLRPEAVQRERRVKATCDNFVVVLDNAAKRNVTVCPEETLRETNVYLSGGNSVNMILGSANSSAVGRHFITKLRAIGCSDIIPPEDAYLKRNGDEVVVGCYTSRKTWHLSCEDGKWIGVIGNCSQGAALMEPYPQTESKPASQSNEQVLIMFALGGFTLALCLAIVCFGAVCWRRFYSKSKMKQEYKTLSYQTNFNGVQPVDRSGVHPNVASDYSGNDMRGICSHPMPTYSVFVGDGELNEEIKSVNICNQSAPL